MQKQPSIESSQTKHFVRPSGHFSPQATGPGPIVLHIWEASQPASLNIL
jgi:hypothetical protein